MKLKCVTCSGANEHTNIEKLVDLFCNYNETASIGIQVSGKKASFGMARFWWIMALYYHLKEQELNLNIALHINQDWVERFCSGDAPDEIEHFLGLTLSDGENFIKKVQLNFKIGREKEPKVETIIQMMKKYPELVFIFQHNDSNAEFIQQLYNSGAKFELLFDSSFGEGIVPENRPAPIFDDIPQGYAGGLSPENVAEEIDKISKVVPSNGQFSIDAEGKLKGDDGHFSLEKCRAFLEEASKRAQLHEKKAHSIIL
ncbi:MAG: hypothetical protein IJZ30_02185 [Alphaproteobacteria bacterium]|nr:hypothetical protein [Alphaproteobacteria bacterium]